MTLQQFARSPYMLKARKKYVKYTPDDHTRKGKKAIAEDVAPRRRSLRRLRGDELEDEQVEESDEDEVQDEIQEEAPRASRPKMATRRGRSRRANN